MDPIIGGSLISAGANLLGGLLGGNKNNHAGRDARQAVTYANYSSIVDRVKAAKDAGIHPLYALGAPTGAFQAWGGSSGGEPSIGSALSQMGADVGRAVAAGQTDAERALQALTLDKAALENDYLREQIHSIRNRTIRESAPPLPPSAVPGMIPEKVVPPQRTSGVNVAVPFNSNPYFSDGQTHEDRYGEVGGAILGLLNIPADLGYTMYRNYRRYSGSMKAFDNRRKSGYYGR